MTSENNASENATYISFNQTEKYACFGTPIGFYIYSLNPFKKVLSRKIDSGVSIVKMLYESNIIIFVGKTDKGLYPNNKLIIWDDCKKTVLGEITYNCPIENINVTKDYIVVLLDKKIYIYNFENLYLIKTIDIVGHPNKLLCMGLEHSDYLVYPGDAVGSINITKLSDEYLETIQAHNSNIENLSVSNDGKYIVTASEKGTIIRIFDTETLEKKNEFRRGCDPTTINDLKLSHNNAILLVSSVKGTIHLYNTGIDPDLHVENTSYDSYGMPLIKWALPQYFSDKFSFLQFNLADISTVSSFDRTSSKIYSFGQDGQYYELNYADINNPTIEKTIKYISDENDPFAERSSTIK
tara:strand:- start:339 stop:1397 length:1059 start_codon:yes stop_codon:yes gene_type:complete